MGQCQIDVNTGLLSACLNSSLLPVGSTLAGLSVNLPGTVSYLTSNLLGIGTVSQCSIDIGGLINLCIPSLTSLTAPLGAGVLNPSNTLLYVITGGGTGIQGCSVGSGGILSACVDVIVGAGLPVTGLSNIVLNTAGTAAYVTEGAHVFQCNVSLTTGLLSACVNLGLALSSPVTDLVL